MLKIFYILCFSLIFIRGEIKPPDALRENLPRSWALVGAKVHVEPGIILDDAIIIVRDGLIEDVGNDLDIPPDVTFIDMAGKIIYPGFIDSWLEISANRQDESDHEAHWNFKVHARRELSRLYEPDETKLKKLHGLGFTSAHIVPDSGIFQGKTALFQLNDQGTNLKSDIAQNIAYEVDGWGSDLYPNALLGVVALIRQTFLDASWYMNAKEKYNRYPLYNETIRTNKDLEVLGSWIENNKPFIMKTNHELALLRSFNIAKEYKLNYWILGSGYEYRRISEIADKNPFIILPLNFPSTPDISDPYQELTYTTSEFKHWDMAPDNPGIIDDHGILMAFTSHGLDKNEFRENLNRSIQRSLSEKTALSALTTIPSKMMGMENKLGKIKKGFLANLTITNGNYFEDKSEVISVWIGGEEYSVKPRYDIDVSGVWNFSIEKKRYKMELNKQKQGYVGKFIIDAEEIKFNKLKVEGPFIRWQVKLDSSEVVSRFTGHILDNQLEGNAPDQDLKWSAIRIGDIIKKEKDDVSEMRSELSVFYPEGAYGWEKLPKKEKLILIKNTTLWTCSTLGTQELTDILFQDGKIKKIGKNIDPPIGSMIINGEGKHVTPGLIDCHSHSAAFSINEGTQSITSEVRIQDVLNSDDIAIYRELAGGLTMANILHGSANTIGGQNAVIKLRWGENPDNLLYENARKGIKFALGENVKQSNWGDDNVTRYPQTRMGVEQILRDAFITAKEYQREWIDYENNQKKWKKKISPRRDLELDALVEILNGERQIHCHSYRQDEILMLTRVAEDFNFTIGTFQHVLEGYKVADRIAEHGAHASTFSDWWAYKYEVIDAIPYNGAIMADVGVNVSFNSDSGELARRMNTEAAKGIKYGGLSEEEALKLVTLNPAIQLGVDKWVGSLEIGKDADFVIWSDHPLSTISVCEQTWINGIQYFSIEEDAKLRLRDENLRKKLRNKILSQKKSDKKKVWKHEEEKSVNHHHCLEDL